jgi:nitroreductase
MNVIDAIRERRSVKEYSDEPVDRETLTALLELAVLAPNHRMTAPWGFLVLGPEARRAYGEVKGGRRARKVDDPDVAETILRKTIEEAVALPALVAVTQRLDDDAEIREEDFASVYMGIQNVLLAAMELGLGAHVKTGAVLDDPATRAAFGVGPDDRVVALVQLGTPAAIPKPKPRRSAAEVTRWLP